MTLGAGGLLRFPIELKIGCRKAFSSPGLPAPRRPGCSPGERDPLNQLDKPVDFVQSYQHSYSRYPPDVGKATRIYRLNPDE